MTNKMTANQWKEILGLIPHPEGGFYRQNYKSSEFIREQNLPARFSGPRSFATAIYFLLDNTDFSAFHRIRQDEIWHFYAGSTLIIHEIDLQGEYRKTRLGIDWQQNEVPQAIIPAGHLFGATLSEAGGYALLGCTVAPGFEFDDFELPGRAALLSQYPRHRTIIESLTRTGQAWKQVQGSRKIQ
ncbi:MAG: cupin domain-containing protein [Methylococcales bacterium]